MARTKPNYRHYAPFAHGGHNWLNDTSREINEAIENKRKHQPSTATTNQWYQEYLDSGAQYRTTWLAYRAEKLEQWRVSRWRFQHGPYRGKMIGRIFKQDLKYIIHVLQYQPRSKCGKMITHFVNRNPGILNSIP